MILMGIIKRSYSTNFYEWPIGKERKHTSILKWKSVMGQPIIVYYPLLTFDPISNYDNQKEMLDRGDSLEVWQGMEYEQLERRYIPIRRNHIPVVHEKIKANFNFFDNLELLLKVIEQNFKVPNEEWLWDDTGYWTAKDSKYSYMGLSEESAFDLWSNSSNLTLCYVASNPSMLLEFKLDKTEGDSFYLNIYYGNRFVVFPDLIDAVHKSLDGVGNWELLNSQKGNDSTIIEGQYRHRELIYELPDTTFSIIPARVIPLYEPPTPGTDFLFAVALKNTFFKIEDTINEPEGFAIVIRGGGWLREDFQRGKKYHVVSSEVRKLENCYVASLVVDEIKEKDSGNEILVKNFLNDPDLSSINNLLNKYS